MIPFTKPIIEEAEIEAVKRVLESGMLAEGKVSREFEKLFSEFVGTKFATVTSNGTTALSTALEAMGIQPGDEVITSPFTFIASANSIAMVGAVSNLTTSSSLCFFAAAPATPIPNPIHVKNRPM